MRRRESEWASLAQKMELSNYSCRKSIKIQTDQNVILGVWSFKHNAGRKDEKIKVIRICERQNAYSRWDPVWLWRIFADSSSFRPSREDVTIQVATPWHFYSVSKVFSSSESQLTCLIKRDMKVLLLLNQSLAAATSGTQCHWQQCPA